MFFNQSEKNPLILQIILRRQYYNHITFYCSYCFLVLDSMFQFLNCSTGPHSLDELMEIHRSVQAALEFALNEKFKLPVNTVLHRKECPALIDNLNPVATTRSTSKDAVKNCLVDKAESSSTDSLYSYKISMTIGVHVHN